MAPNIAQSNAPEYKTSYLHTLITISTRYFHGGEVVEQSADIATWETK